MTTPMAMYPTFQPTHQQPQHSHFFVSAPAALSSAVPSYTMPSYMQMLANTHTQHAAQQSASAAYTTIVPEELRCQYSSKRCEHRRTHKKSGGLHKFCAVHREKANRNQMRLDHRRRVLKRLAQRTGGAAPSSPTSTSAATVSASSASSGRSSPYTKKRTALSAKSPRNNSNHHHNNNDGKNGIWSVEDDLDVDLMPLALHHENNPAAARAQQSLLDAQDLHILETLLFSDDDTVATATGVQLRKLKKDMPKTATIFKSKKSNDEDKGWNLNL